jgi:hypothetical protein
VDSGKAKDGNTGSIVGEQIDKNTQKDSTKVKENPYWFEDWIVKDSVQQQQNYHSENAQHHHSSNGNNNHHGNHHNTRRAKRNHYRKLKTLHNHNHGIDDESIFERIITKRSLDYQEDEIYIPDEIYTASEVIGNIYNANDTIHDNFDNNGNNNNINSNSKSDDGE